MGQGRREATTWARGAALGLAVTALSVWLACSPFEATSDVPPGADATPADALDAAAAAAAADAADAADAGDSWCARQVGLVLCDDFDTNAVRVPPWDQVALGDGGSLVVASDASVSAPNALRVSVPIGSGGFQQANLRKVLKAAARTRVAADLLIESIDPSGVASLIIIFLTKTTDYSAFNVSIESSNATRYLAFYAVEKKDGGATNQGKIPFTLAPGKWSRVQLELDLAASPQTASVLDGDGNLLEKISLPPVTASEQDVRVGLPFVKDPAGSEWTVRLDNVAISVGN